MAMHCGTRIRERRQHLGLTDTEVAAASGLTIHQYDDIEQHPHEFVSNVSLGNARRVCVALGLQLRGLLGLPSEPTHLVDVSSLVRESRLARKLSRADVADRIGFNETVIQSLEDDKLFADTLPISVLFDLEQVLGISRGSLIP